ncbi:hypothetical protein BH11ARM2_BH11ARM2_05350 [soil metagenome]
MLLPVLLGAAFAERPLTPITADLPVASLSDVCRLLSEKTGLPFDCATNIRDRKTTLLCEKIPAADVMARMEEGMFLRFLPRGQGFLLEADPDVSAEESRYETAVANARRVAARNGIARIIEFTKVGADVRQAETEEVRKRYENAKTPEDRAKIYPDLAFRQQMGRGDRTYWDAGSLMGQLSSGEIDALLNGRPIVGDNAGLGTGHDLPADSFVYSMPSSKGNGALGILQYHPETGYLNFSLRSMPKDGGSGAVMYSLYLQSSEVKEHALSNRISVWAKERDAEVDGTAIQPGEPPVVVSPKGVLSMVEHFRWLHARSGVPIVAEVTRAAVSFPIAFKGGTVGEWMNETHIRRDFSHEWTLYNFHTSHGWLMARPGGLLRIRKTEVPERTLTPFAGKPDLTLDEMARFAGLLDDGEIEGLTEKDWAYPLSLMRIQPAIDSLRVYDALGAQRRFALSEHGITREAMPPAARQKLSDLVIRRLIGGWPEPSLVPFLTGAARLDSVPMSFQVGSAIYGTLLDERIHDTSNGDYGGGMGKNYEAVRFRTTLAGQDYDDYVPLKLKEDR